MSHKRRLVVPRELSKQVSVMKTRNGNSTRWFGGEWLDFAGNRKKLQLPQYRPSERLTGILTNVFHIKYIKKRGIQLQRH